MPYLIFRFSCVSRFFKKSRIENPVKSMGYQFFNGKNRDKMHGNPEKITRVSVHFIAILIKKFDLGQTFCVL